MIGVFNSAAKGLLVACIIYCGSASGQQEQAPKLIELNYDDGSGVVGELIDFADGKYRLKTSVGVITVPDDGVLCNGDACPEKAIPPVPGKAIKLTSLDGTTVLSGELLEVSDGMYVVSTSIGVIKIEVDLVHCEGNDCVLPLSNSQESDVTRTQ